MTVPLIRVLLVEDNPGDAFLIQMQFRETQTTAFQIVVIQDLETAITHLKEDSFDVILLDLSLPDSQGLETLLAIETQNKNIPIVVLTGLNDEDLAVRAVRQGAEDYLVKGQVTGELLTRSIRYAIERKQIQEELKQRTQELESLNQELEAFSYTVSHDLKNPLTVIKGMSGLLLECSENELEKLKIGFLEEIHKHSLRMEHIIQDLLRLSLAKQGALQIQSVDLSGLVQQIVRQIQQKQPTRQVEFAIAPEIVAQGDPDLLQNALENLLENAWKYTGETENARIEFGAIDDRSVLNKKPVSASPTNHEGKDINQEVIYFIKDNGIGFKKQDAEQLFVPFQRLDNARRYEGNGIGLATVQRIVRRHGGRIWAEAEIDGGATFYFTLSPLETVPSHTLLLLGSEEF